MIAVLIVGVLIAILTGVALAQIFQSIQDQNESEGKWWEP